MKNRTKLIRAVPALLAGLTLLLAVACGNVGGSGGSGSGGGPTITVGSKNFTEQYILGNMYAQALEANGFDAQTKLDLGSEQIADKALQSGQIDLYPEYTGTALVAIVPFKGNPSDLNSPKATYDAAKKLYAKRSPADTMLTPAPFNNTYGIFVRKSVAEDMGITNLKQLSKASPKLTFISYSEFQNRSDGYPNVKKNYPAFDFKEGLAEQDEERHSKDQEYRSYREGDEQRQAPPDRQVLTPPSRRSPPGRCGSASAPRARLSELLCASVLPYLSRGASSVYPLL